MIWPSSRTNGTSWLRTSSTARAPGRLRGRGSKPGIENSRIMYAELAHRRVDRHHFGGEIARNVQALLRGENVEFAGIEDQPVVGPRENTSPQ